jgi:predicted MPP superfamily phosphohydrolase
LFTDRGVRISGGLRIRALRLAFLVVLGISCGLGVYAFWIEPNWIEVTRHKILAPLNTPIKIAHLTDIHTSSLAGRELKMLELLEREQPDLIAITGDSISVTSDYPGLRDVISRLHAPLGVWIVRGNHEDWWPIEDEAEFYRSAGARFLLNSSGQARADVWLVGFDDQFGGSPDANKAFAAVPESAYRIALFHSPTFLANVAGRCDLALAGHTHGGQVRLPFIGPLWLPPYSGKFVRGWFDQQGTRMYVSRGIGTSILDVRFLSRPEIAIITIGEKHLD